MKTPRSLLVWTLLLCLPGPLARGELAPEPVGVVRSLPEDRGPHWVWLSDLMIHRTALFDGDSGDMLGAISAGTAGVGFVIAPLFSPDRREIYIPETYFSRGVRGDRTDVVTVYDGRTLQPLEEIEIPAKRAEYYPGNAANAISDDGRFVAVFNLTPATSLTVVDVKERRLAAEVPAPGCSLVFAAGPRRFFMLCPNGEALVVELDEAGNARRVERTAAFFDPKDPVTEKAVRRGDEWLFVSFEGRIHSVEVGGAELRFGEPWSLFTAADRDERWRVGGAQHLAVHGPTKRLYVLVHQGEPDTHKEPGTEVWVYDLENRTRAQRIRLDNPLARFVALQAGLGDFARRLLGWLLPHPGIDRILVSGDADPLLFASGTLPPTLTVYDALSGEVRRDIAEPGIAATLLYAP